MNSILYTIGMVAIWGINLLNGTGLGATYKTTELAMVATLILMIGCLCFQALREGDINVPPKYFYTISLTILIFVGVSYLNNRGMTGVIGFWVYMLVYVLSRVKVTIKAQRLASICYGVLGLVILYIFDYMDAMDGWNTNSIAMIGLFSFLIFTIPFFGVTDWRGLLVLPVVGAAYVFLIWPTDSRSCIIVILVALLIVFRIIPIKKVLSSSKMLFLILLVPLFIAVFVCLLSSFGDISGLAELNRDIFGKSLFNGRDEIWLDGFNQLWKNPLFGNGFVTSGYWHNSAMACLTAFGVVGYFLWILLFYLILKEGQPYLDDVCVTGSMVAFLLLSCQQAVEQGIFAPNPSLLPYTMLGIMLGRVNYLRSERRCLR